MGLFDTRHALKLLLVDNAYEIANEQEWLAVQDYVHRWFADLKVEESYDTFDGAFQDSRMTVRCILQARQTGHYEEKVPIRGQEGEGGVRSIKTMQGVAGVRERMKYANFMGQGLINREKYTNGLFDVSAVLLDGKREMKIGDGVTQMYRTGGDTTYVFMPVSRQADMVCFFLLSLLAKQSTSGGLKAFVQVMKSRLTRIKLAFEADAGCKFLDFAPQGDALPRFKYGFGKIMKATATDEEVARRKAAAMKYKDVLLGNNRNEIVIAYRQHGTLSKPSAFPIFAKAVFIPKSSATEWACANCGFHKGFVVVTDSGELTKEIITLKGEKRLWRSDDFGERARVTCAGACPRL